MDTDPCAQRDMNLIIDRATEIGGDATSVPRVCSIEKVTTPETVDKKEYWVTIYTYFPTASSVIKVGDIKHQLIPYAKGWVVKDSDPVPTTSSGAGSETREAPL